MSAASDCAVHEVSVVIPVHNGESFVRAAIDSVLAQSGCAVEVIVVDSASSDRSSAVVKEAYGARVILAKEERPGAARARNAGARLASRPWLAFLDADDVWLPEKLAKQIAAAEAAPGCDLVFTLGEEFLDSELSEEERTNFSVRPLPYALLTPSSLLLRRETFLAAGEFPDVPAGEFIAWQGWARELGLREQVAPEVLVRRRIHAHNMTRSASNRAGYPMAAKWLLDRRRQRARSFATQI